MAISVKVEPFELNRNVSGMSEADISIATGEGLQDIWTYKVPVGHRLRFSNAGVFAAYLENASAVEAAAGSLVDIVIKDSSKQITRPLLNQLRYQQVKEFQDIDKLTRLDVEPGRIEVASEGEYVIVRGNILTATLDASDSYFKLSCTRERKSLFE